MRESLAIESPRVLLLQTAMGDYRAEFLRLLRQACDIEVVVGERYFDPTVQTDFELIKPEFRCRNSFLFGNRFLWQRKVIAGAAGAKALVAEGNPRIISTWMILILRRLLRRPTVLWAHAWSRKGETARSNVIRLWMFRLADGLLVYTDAQKEALSVRLPTATIDVAANSLYLGRDMVPTTGSARTDIVYCGRMVEGKRPALLVDAFLNSIALLPEGIRLVMVGDGPLRDELMARTKSEQRVCWMGQVSEPDKLAEIYSTAIVAVSPGYVGLSLSQALGFGVPMLIADDEPHAPEVASARPGVNSVYFRARDRSALSDALLAVVEDRRSWGEKLDLISASARSEFSVESMVRGFVSAVRHSIERVQE